MKRGDAIGINYSDHAPGLFTNALWQEQLDELTLQAVHEVKNYITGVMSLSETWMNGVEDGHPLRELTRLLLKRSRKTNLFMEGISDLHRRCPGSMNYHDLNQIVEDVATFLSTVSGVPVIPTHRSADELPVYVDAVDLQRVLIVLLFNGTRSHESARGVSIRVKRSTMPDASKGPSDETFSSVGQLILRNLPLAGWKAQGGNHADHAEPTAQYVLEFPRLRVASDFIKRHHGLLEVEFVDENHCNLCMCLPEVKMEHDVSLGEPVLQRKEKRGGE